MNVPILSVIVCTYNRAALLPLCLQSLIEQTLPTDKYEIIVVDNNSIDNTEIIINNFCQLYDKVRSIKEFQQGLSYARNRGWQEARGQYVAFIDDDAKAAPEWCERIVYAFQNVKPCPDSVGGPVLSWFEHQPPSWINSDYETRTWGYRPRFLEENSGTFWGMNMAFPRQILEIYHGFNTKLGVNGNTLGLGEETDLYQRIAKNKQLLLWYDPSIVVYNYVSMREMGTWYRISRAYHAGVAQAQYNQITQAKTVCTSVMKDIVINIIKLPVALLYTVGAVCIHTSITYICEISRLIGHINTKHKAV